MADLINSYVNTINQGVSSAFNAAKSTFTGYNNSIDTKDLVKPKDGKGHLVENNLLTAPKEAISDMKYTTKALYKGIKGDANDHELGKLNDLGLKLGGIAIATYLMTKRQTPKAKLMEFVGFGTFLASMSLWPKIALQWPARLIHGFNFRKQYVDEQGRKKYVTQDPNYIPFDLYKGNKKSENLSVIGDRMHIAKDINDRNEIVKEQMRKISVQNNTMWMLTAGAATPIMTSLVCNALEKPIGKAAEVISNKKINKLVEEIDSYLNADPKTNVSKIEDKLVNSNIDKEAERNLESLLASKEGKVINKRDLREISKAMAKGLDTQTKKAAMLDLSELIKPNNTVIKDYTGHKIVNSLKKAIDKQYGKGFSETIIDSEKISKHVKDFMSTNGSILSQEKSEELRKSISTILREGIDSNTSLSPSRKNMLKGITQKSVEKTLEASKGAVLTKELISTISEAGGHIRKYRALDETISKATHFKVEKAPETIVGNNWGDVTDTLIKELNITPQKLEEARSSEQLTAKLFTRKLEDIAKDENRYKTFVTNISEKMAELDVKLDTTENGGSRVMDTIVGAIEKNSERTERSLTEKGHFYNLGRRISGENIDGVQIGSLRQAKIDRIKQARVGSVQSSYMRLLHTADFFKRAAEYEQTGKGFGENPNINKAVIQKGKELLMSSHSGDFFLKFQTGNNAKFYKELMKHVFGSGESSKATEEALNKKHHQVFASGAKTSMVERMKAWALHINDLMGTNKYDFQPNHSYGIDHFSNYAKTAVEKFNKIACTPDTMLHNALKQTYNSRKWMKTWGTAGGILLAGTVASQFAFGGKDSSIKQ